ncbi:MAG: SPOR domain-containing protein [Alphaproteobacteria bacterium]|nr:SPOR domain-containing protein [Alphaproteobacteria bacterium]
MPPTLAAASYAADGASIVVSGKSVTDHAISGMADQDCAMIRVVRLRRPCRAYVGEQVAASPPVPAGPAAASPAAGFGPPVQPASGDLVLGSFAYRANADELARRHGDLGAHVVLARVEGQPRYQVLVPVHSAETARTLRHRLAADDGVEDPWMPPRQRIETASVDGR